MKSNNIYYKIEKRMVHEVTVNSDRIEGRGNTITVGHYINKDIAEKICGKEPTGHIESKIQNVIVFCYKNGLVESINLIGDLVDITDEDPNVIKARALAKLSESERKALGF
jgi:hypothetical protein